MNNEVDDDPRGDNMPDQPDNTLVESINILDVQFSASAQSIITKLRHFLIKPIYYTDDFETNEFSWVTEKNEEIKNLFLSLGRPYRLNTVGYVVFTPVDNKSIIHVEIYTSSRIPIAFDFEESRIHYRIGVNLLKNLAMHLIDFYPRVNPEKGIFPRMFAKSIIIENHYEKPGPGRPRNPIYEECRERLANGERDEDVRKYFYDNTSADLEVRASQWNRIRKEVYLDKQKQSGKTKI